MQSQVHSLASHLLSRLDALASNVDGPSQKRLLVGIVGVPGSGKSELAIKVGEEVERLRKKRRETGKRSDETSVREYDDTEEVTVVIGMDGWHYSRAELDTFPDPADAHARRGAHDTFDSQRFVQFVQALRQGSSIADIDLPSRSTFESNDNASPSETFPTDLPSHPPVLLAPTFSHANKDPVPSSLPIHRHYQLIILEGLYLALSIPPWNKAAKLLDEIILIEVEESVARERVIRRHVGAGLCKDEVDAGRRADENDMPNGRFLLANLIPPTIRIHSVNDLSMITQLTS